MEQSNRKVMNEIIGEANSCLNESQIKCNCEEKSSNYCVRFLRKKYKCCLLWLLSIISFTQLIYIILDKIDNSLLQNIVIKLLNLPKNSTMSESP